MTISLRRTTAVVSLSAAGAVAIWLTACGGTATGSPVDQQLAARQNALETRQAELQRRSDDLAATSQRLTEQALALDGRRQQLDAREAALTERDASLARRASNLDRSQAEVHATEQRLGSEQARLESRDAELAAQREAVEAARAKLDAELRQQPARAWVVAELPRGSELAVELVGTLSSASSQVGDSFHGRVTRDVHSADGLLVVPAGSLLEGVVEDVVAAPKVGGQASLALRFESVALPSGQRIPLRATLSRLGRDTGGRDAATIGGAAAGGAILGRILGHDRKKGTLIGAVIGAAAGTAAAANRSHDDVVIPAGSSLVVALEEKVVAQLPWTPRSAAE